MDVRLCAPRVAVAGRPRRRGRRAADRGAHRGADHADRGPGRRCPGRGLRLHRRLGVDGRARRGPWHERVGAAAVPTGSTPTLLAAYGATPDVKFLHCLPVLPRPRHRRRRLRSTRSSASTSVEVTDEVFEVRRPSCSTRPRTACTPSRRCWCDGRRLSRRRPCRPADRGACRSTGRPTRQEEARRCSSPSSSALSSAGRCEPNWAKYSPVSSASADHVAGSMANSSSSAAGLTSRPLTSSAPAAGARPIGVSTAPVSLEPLDDPLEDPAFSPKPGQRNEPSAPLRNQLTWKTADFRTVVPAHVHPMAPVVGHVVAAERQHRQRVAAQRADLPFGRGRLLAGHRGAEEDSVLPVEGLVDQRDVRGAAAAEQDRVDRDAFRVPPIRGDRRALRRGRGEAEFGCAAAR